MISRDGRVFIGHKELALNGQHYTNYAIEVSERYATEWHEHVRCFFADAFVARSWTNNGTVLGGAASRHRSQPGQPSIREQDMNLPDDPHELYRLALLFHRLKFATPWTQGDSEGREWDRLGINDRLVAQVALVRRGRKWRTYLPGSRDCRFDTLQEAQAWCDDRLREDGVLLLSYMPRTRTLTEIYAELSASTRDELYLIESEWKSVWYDFHTPHMKPGSTLNFNGKIIHMLPEKV